MPVKNINLKDLFDSSIQQYPSACAFTLKGVEYLTAPGSIYSKTAAKAGEDVPPTLYGGKESMPPGVQEAWKNFMPGYFFHLLLAETTPAEGLSDIVVCADAICSLSLEGAVWKFDSGVFTKLEDGSAHYTLRVDCKLFLKWAKSATAKIGIGVGRGGAPVLVLGDKDETLVLGYSKVEACEDIEFHNGEKLCKLAGWNDVQKLYKKVLTKGEKIMPKDFSLPGLTVKAMEEAVGKVQAEVIMKESVEATEQIEALQDTVLEAETPEAAVEQVAQAAGESVVEISKSDKQKEKATRKRNPKAPLVDLTAVTESLVAEVPDNMSPEAALKELRQIRDLQQAAARRAANVAIAMIETSKEALATLAQIKGIVR